MAAMSWCLKGSKAKKFQTVTYLRQHGSDATIGKQVGGNLRWSKLQMRLAAMGQLPHTCGIQKTLPALRRTLLDFAQSLFLRNIKH